ncbi:MAG: CBS domain-containing protein [Pseudomonadales bacterium]
MSVSELGLRFAQIDPERVARVLEKAADPQEAVEFLTQLPEDVAVEVVARLAVARADRIVNLIPHAQLGAWLDAAPTDTSIRVVTRLSTIQATEAIDAMASSEQQRLLRRTLAYATDSVGMVLNTDVWAIHENVTVNEVIAELRRRPANGSPLFSLNNADEVVGVIQLEHLIRDETGAGLARDYSVPVNPVLVESPMHAVLERLTQGDLHALPVVDHKGRLQGYVTRSTLVNACADQGEVAGGVSVLIDLAVHLISVLSEMLTVLFARDRTS